ncbi:MAG TPA: hypothetical protein VJK26_00205, partial [Patescibacteria group bacterium]|nr:hypothetical protein [Patescibacteria group bacterium]
MGNRASANNEFTDSEILKIWKSTRTLTPKALPLHNALRLRFRWYYRWHLNPFSSIVHSGILAI